jgi:hypothetical protein
MKIHSSNTIGKNNKFQDSFNNENVGPQGSKTPSSRAMSNTGSPTENKTPFPITPTRVKIENAHYEFSHMRESTKPSESPFTEFCKGLSLSPGMCQMQSPGLIKQVSFGPGYIS